MEIDKRTENGYNTLTYKDDGDDSLTFSSVNKSGIITIESSIANDRVICEINIDDIPKIVDYFNEEYYTQRINR